MSAAPQVGEILAGKYRVERVLGQGGMGVVVQAHHLQLEERVAVKFLLPAYAEHPEAATRFLREARAAVKIKSEHVARVIDVGTLDTGAPFMVMEFLEGQDLSERLESAGALPVEAAVEHILQACEAIAEAHAAGIVHRDLKPANLFLTSRADGTASVKVLDFGISKVTQAGDSGPDMSLTKTSTMMGSPLYMSPEQMRSSRDVDPRSDIWSLGAILYELLSGRTPFTGESLPQLCTQILSEPPTPLRETHPHIPVEVERAVLRCLTKDRHQRYSSVAELASDLAPFAPRTGRQSAERISRVLGAAGLSTSSNQLAAEARTAMGPGVGTLSAWGQTATRTGSRNSPNRTLVLASLAGVVIMVVGIAGVLALRSGSADGSMIGEASSAAAESIPPPPAPSPEVLAPELERPAPAATPVVSVPAPVVSSSAPPPEPPPVRVPPKANKVPPKPVPKVVDKPPEPPPPARGTDLFGDRK